MNRIVDNLIAYRVLSMMVQPFTDTEAYKLGIVDEDGNNLIKSRDFTTIEQKNAYNYLTRLVFNLKKILNKLPGGESKTKNIVAAFFLLKEAYEKGQSHVDECHFKQILDLLDEGVVLAEAQLAVERFLTEDAPANATGPAVATDEPVIRKKKKAQSIVGPARKVLIP